MITRIYNENMEQYTRLFNTINSDKSIQSALGEGKTIESLEDYFRNIKAIGTTKEIYLRMPIDEDVFEIDADTRTISVPKSFANNGVSVQGDESAEIVYFLIDRYFDATDLGLDDINIYIQWEHSSGVSGVSLAFGKDLASQPGKIIFGWPITSDITANSGTVKFSVRFYKREGNKVIYSFSTLTQTIAIKSALVLSSGEIDNAYDASKFLKDRLMNSNIESSNIDEPKIYVYSWDSNDGVKNLSLDTDTVTLYVYAYSPTLAGKISYKWYQYDVEGNKVELDDVTAAGEDYYLATIDTEYDSHKKYYICEEDKPTHYSEVTETQFATIVTTNAGLSDEDAKTIIYEKCNSFVANAAGKYRVIVTCTDTILEGAYTEKKSDYCVIPGPTSLTVKNIADRGILKDNSTLTLAVEVASEDDTNYVQYSYQWLKNDVEIENAEKSNYSPTEAGSYRVVVTNTLNKESISDTSNPCRVTHMPKAPTLEYSTNGVKNAVTGSGTCTFAIELKYNDSDERDSSDKDDYQWYNFNPENVSDYRKEETEMRAGTYIPSTKDKAIDNETGPAYTTNKVDGYFCIVTHYLNGEIVKVSSPLFTPTVVSSD